MSLVHLMAAVGPDPTGLFGAVHPAPAIRLWLETIGTPPPGAQPSPSATPASFGSNVFGFSFLLSPLVWGPALMAAVIGLMPNPRGRYERWFLGIAFWTSASVLALTLIGYQQFQVFTTGVQFEERLPWLPAIGVGYHLGVDGIGIAMLLLSALVGLCAVIASWDVRERPRSYFALMLLVQAAVNGAVVARDFFVLLLFWSAAAVPLALLVLGSGERARRHAAAWRLLAYWGLGSAALLSAGLLLYSAAGASDFDLDTLTKAVPSGRIQVVVGMLLVLAAGSRLPLVPLHG